MSQLHLRLNGKEFCVVDTSAVTVQLVAKGCSDNPLRPVGHINGLKRGFPMGLLAQEMQGFVIVDDTLCVDATTIAGFNLVCFVPGQQVLNQGVFNHLHCQSRCLGMGLVDA